MVEVSRGGRRGYWTNSLYSTWDETFYPDGVGAWTAKADVDTDRGGMTLNERFCPRGDAFRGNRGCTRAGCREEMPRATPTASADARRLGASPPEG